MNQVLLTGRVATEPRLIETSTHLCTFRIAVRRSVKNNEDAKTDFFTIVAWSGLADICSRHLALGREISVGGRLRTRSYVKDDSINWVTEIVADKIEFMGPKRQIIEDGRLMAQNDGCSSYTELEQQTAL